MANVASRVLDHLFQCRHHPVVEIERGDWGHATGLGLGTPYSDHDLFLLVDVEPLPLDAGAVEGAVFTRGAGRWDPPEIAVVQRRAAREYLGRASLGEPPIWQDGLSGDGAVVHDEEAEAGVLLRGVPAVAFDQLEEV